MPKQAVITKMQTIEDINPDQKRSTSSHPVSTDAIHGISIRKEKNNPTYATISQMT